MVEGMNLLFADCETTGLSPTNDRLLEVGMVVVKLPTFEVVDQKNWVLWFDRVLTAPDRFIHTKVHEMHETSGLWAECLASKFTDLQKVDSECSQWAVAHDCQGSALGGAGPSFDRDFFKVKLPKLASLLHYRNFDTNAFWLLQSYITGQEPTRDKAAAHRAIPDCLESIGEVERHFDWFTKFCGAVP
jgi:oligoribonuclease (3'-5' exoribonuclease)